MNGAKLSILGLYNYNNSIFEKLKLPEGVDNETAINTILFNCAELSLVYPDDNIIKTFIGLWCSKNYSVWEKLYKTTVLEYNPIWNVDGTTTERSKHVTEEESSGERKETETGSGKDKLSGKTAIENKEKEIATPNLRETRSKAGYNSETWQNYEQLVNDGLQTREIETTGENVINNTTDRTNKVNKTVRDKDNNKVNEDLERVVKREGNIGVTTTQKMIQEERETDLFNIYDYIANDFKKTFCIMVY